MDLGEIAGSIAAELRQREPSRKVEMTIAPGLVARGEHQLLRIVLENLLGNAWKYTGKRESASVEFGMTQKDGKRVFFVRDNGAGFDMAYAGRLFAPFQRLHGESEFPGAGIGLATVQRIVRRHGGQVWAEGCVGEGATFYFTILDDDSLD